MNWRAIEKAYAENGDGGDYLIGRQVGKESDLLDDSCGRVAKEAPARRNMGSSPPPKLNCSAAHMST